MSAKVLVVASKHAAMPVSWIWALLRGVSCCKRYSVVVTRFNSPNSDVTVMRVTVRCGDARSFEVSFAQVRMRSNSIASGVFALFSFHSLSSGAASTSSSYLMYRLSTAFLRLGSGRRCLLAMACSCSFSRPVLFAVVAC